MSDERERFKHVSYLWDKTEAAKLAGDEVALLLCSCYCNRGIRM